MIGLDMVLQEGDITKNILVGILEKLGDSYKYLIYSKEMISWSKPIPDVPIRLDQFYSYKELLERISWAEIILFLDIQCYKKKDEESDIETYIDYVNSSCEAILLVADLMFLEVYIKNKKILADCVSMIDEELTKDYISAIVKKKISVEKKIEGDDPRTIMHVD